ASSAKGNRDAIDDGINGFLFEYDNSTDLARTIDKAYRLKNDDWLPVFKHAGSAAKDFDEILSYYN
ncbi:MAG: hypothetical protein ACTHM5_10770, partial [Ginsengibacter sp.]